MNWFENAAFCRHSRSIFTCTISHWSQKRKPRSSTPVGFVGFLLPFLLRSIAFNPLNRGPFRPNRKLTARRAEETAQQTAQGQKEGRAGEPAGRPGPVPKGPTQQIAQPSPGRRPGGPATGRAHTREAGPSRRRIEQGHRVPDAAAATSQRPHRNSFAGI